MRPLSRAALVFVGLLAAACAQAVTTPQPDLAAEERAIRDADARWLKAAQTKDVVADGAAGEDRGRYVTVWKKVNGEWKVAYDIGSSTMPAVPADKTKKK